MQKILIISEQNGIKEKLADFLASDLYGLEHSPTPQQGLAKWQSFRPDLVILDINLKMLNGKDICTIMKEKNDQSKILFIDSEQGNIKGLQSNSADSNPDTLLRDINNLLNGSNHIYSFDGNTVDYKSYQAINREKRRFYLNEREINIFRLFSQEPERLIKREEILENVWQSEVFPSSLTIERYINKLRKVFEPNPEKPIYFHSIPGLGYKFTPKGQKE